MIYHGDLFDVLPSLDECSIDSAVTDPPYELSFMGKHWDGSGVAFQVSTWQAVRRVLQPGAYLVAFGGTRTYHRMTCAIEDAGFEIRDCFCWLYGSGFPKSMNVGDGRGTALKPAYEPIVLARKPFKGTLRENLQKHGTGAINIDACRLPTNEKLSISKADPFHAADGSQRTWNPTSTRAIEREQHALGRWPANVLLDEEAAKMLDEMTSELHSAGPSQNGGDGRNAKASMFGTGNATDSQVRYGDSFGASRFFYIAKPSNAERNAGIYEGRSTHPTVKPVELMRWLVKLVAPINGKVLDPFAGSGTTGMACAYEFREFIGIEREAEYVEIAKRRIAACAPLFTESSSCD